MLYYTGMTARGVKVCWTSKVMERTLIEDSAIASRNVIRPNSSQTRADVFKESRRCLQTSKIHYLREAPQLGQHWVLCETEAFGSSETSGLSGQRNIQESKPVS